MWTTAVADLRTFLSDNDTDRYYYRKRCIGECNGENTRFKTFEFRRVTDFTQTPGVWITNQLQPTTAIASDDLIGGEFILTNPPDPSDVVEATYYVQWFLDSELETFMGYAAQWLLSSNQYQNIAGGLQAAALNYATAKAYMKMAQRWRTYMSETFKLEDAPNKEGTSPVDSFLKMAEAFNMEAEKERDSFYTRQGRNLQPLFGTVRGHVRNLP